MSRTTLGTFLFLLGGCTATGLSTPSEPIAHILKITTAIPNPDLAETYSKFNECLSQIDITQDVLSVNGQISKCRTALHTNNN